MIIIGAGIVGLSAAYYLKQLCSGAAVSLIHDTSFPTGASTRNAGFACIGSPTELLDDLSMHSAEKVFNIVQMRCEGLRRLRSLVGDDHMDYRATGGYEVFTPEEMSWYEESMNKLDELNSEIRNVTGIPAAFSEGNRLIKRFGFKGISGMISCHAEGTIHPGKMTKRLYRLAQEAGVEIISGARLNRLESEDHEVSLSFDRLPGLRSTHVLLCTNGFTRQLLPDAEVIPARNQVFLTPPLASLPFEGCFHRYKGYYYFRNVGNRVLIGGARHLGEADEQTDIYNNTTLIENHLRQFLSENILPGWNGSFSHKWSGILGIGEAKEPLIKAYRHNIFLAVRMGGMGVAIGSEAGYRSAVMLSEKLDG